MEGYNRLVEYVPPEWCRKLKVLPKFRIPLAMTPTPIHEWKIEDIPEAFQLFVKRDDLTGCLLSGNKVRKLEFLLADAKAKGCTSVVTSGSTQSNHARSTLIAAKQVGMDCHLILRDINENCTTTVPSGNFLLMESANPNIYLLPWTSFKDEQVSEKRNVLVNHIRLHGIVISRTKEMVHNLIDEKLKNFGLNAQAQDIVDIIEGHVGGGYSVFTKEEIAYYLKIAKTTGIYCDPVYVGKAIKGLMDELKNTPKRFKGKRILFIHTGGIFGMMDTNSAQFIRDQEKSSRIKQWSEAFPEDV